MTPDTDTKLEHGYMEYFSPSDEWTDRPLIRIIKNKICMDYKTRITILDAVKKTAGYYMDEHKRSEHPADSSGYLLMYNDLIELKEVIDSIPECETVQLFGVDNVDEIR